MGERQLECVDRGQRRKVGEDGEEGENEDEEEQIEEIEQSGKRRRR